jgi:hypothetical protein
MARGIIDEAELTQRAGKYPRKTEGMSTSTR